MYLSRLTLDTTHPRASEAARTLADPYRLHQILWTLLDTPQATRDFLYRVEGGGSDLRLLLLSVHEVEPGYGPWFIESKPYTPQLVVGQRLAFSLRFNPVVTRRDEAGKAHRHDMVMDRKLRSREAGKPLPSQAEQVCVAARSWLETRAARAGFQVEPTSLLAESYRRYECRRHNKAAPIRFSTIDAQGLLEVTNTDVLRNTLYKGLGPAKAFGCGLLLVRRV